MSALYAIGAVVVLFGLFNLLDTGRLD